MLGYFGFYKPDDPEEKHRMVEVIGRVNQAGVKKLGVNIISKKGKMKGSTLIPEDKFVRVDDIMSKDIAVQFLAHVSRSDIFRAIEEYRRQEKDDDLTVDRCKEVRLASSWLFQGFQFSVTAEGWKYWHRVHKKLYHTLGQKH